MFQEEFEDTKGAFRIRISKKNRQHNGQKKIGNVAINMYGGRDALVLR